MDMLEELKRRMNDRMDTQQRVDEEHAERMGYDCGKNGPTQENCDFRLFSSAEFTRAWERGKKRAQES